MEEVAVEFNAARTEVFPLLTGGVFDVQFSTRSETQSGEVREKTEFVVRHRGREVPYANLSGGQRRRVDLGVMITLVLAVSRSWQVPGVLGLLVLDEVAAGLDPSGTENLVAVLEEVQEIVPAIYVITHDDSMKSHFPQNLHVVQDEHGISRVVN